MTDINKTSEAGMVQVMIEGQKKSYPAGTPYYDIAREYQPGKVNDIVLVLEDNLSLIHI